MGIILIQIQKFNLTIKRKNKIQKLYLNFQFRLKQKSRLEIYFLVFKKLKIDEKIHLGANFGDLTDQISARAKKNLEKNEHKIDFSIFIENRNCDLKLVFGFDNENKNRKNFKIQFHFTMKIKCPFRPTDFP